MAGQSLARLEMDGNRVVREERMLTDLRKRIREVRQGVCYASLQSTA